MGYLFGIVIGLAVVIAIVILALGDADAKAINEFCIDNHGPTAKANSYMWADNFWCEWYDDDLRMHSDWPTMYSTRGAKERYGR